MNFLEEIFVGQNPIERFTRFTALAVEKNVHEKLQILREPLGTTIDDGKASELIQGGYVGLQNE